MVGLGLTLGCLLLAAGEAVQDALKEVGNTLKGLFGN